MLFSGSPPGARSPALPPFIILLSSTDSRNRLEHSTLLAHRHFFPISLTRTVFLLSIILLFYLLSLPFRPLSTVILSTSICFETTTTAATSGKYHRFSKESLRRRSEPPTNVILTHTASWTVTIASSTRTLPRGNQPLPQTGLKNFQRRTLPPHLQENFVPPFDGKKS